MQATKHILLAATTLLLCVQLCAQQLVVDKKEIGNFPIVAGGVAATIVVDKNDITLVQKSAALLQQDIERVSGVKPQLTNSIPASAKNIIIVGSITQSAILQKLTLNPDGIKNKWEAYQVQVVNKPSPGVDQALVIMGSDRRGTAFGVFELSQQMGISPWYWWADVPVKKKNEIYVKKGAVVSDAPAVKYRGIFINDEAPALSGWSKEKFGGFNHLFYEKVFELMLRLKSNYLWPAMWGNAFYDDDTLNQQTADEYGIVIGTSHHEPLMRAHDEWRRYGKGKWNYDSNETRLKDFWRQGLERTNKTEKIVSVGMRGDGDEPMTRETATALLERIVKNQRTIIEEVTGKPATETPQLWALYKEVQDYYDKGMRVPDDVTLLLCDDNWGNIRRLPKPGEKPRKGGYGIYYHFDYVGGPRNYKWLNTNNISRVWEQMHLAWEYNARQIWIVNVGDIKPMELPISFFLDYAWDPDKWNEDNLPDYYTKWASQQFGSTYAKEIGALLSRYAQLSARRKPELLDETTYDIHSSNEFGRVLDEWKELTERAERTGRLLSAEYHDAYFQLVLHPIKALGNLHELYFNVAFNRLNAKESNPSANVYARAARQLYLNDSLITLSYHKLANGKWNHMMSQTHIGYTYWQQPPFNKMPALDSVIDGNPTDTAIDPNYVAPSSLTMVPKNKKGNIFYEKNGYVSIEAANWTNAINSANIKWKTIPCIGRDGSGITTFPVTNLSQLSAASPHVEYEFYTYDTGKATVHFHFSPTLNFLNTEEGLQFAVSIDNEPPQVLSLNKEDKNSISGVWNSWVANNIIIKRSNHQLLQPGKHTLKYWMISPAVILQKLVVDFGGMKPSYLGPPQTLRH